VCGKFWIIGQFFRGSNRTPTTLPGTGTVVPVAGTIEHFTTFFFLLVPDKNF